MPAPDSPLAHRLLERRPATTLGRFASERVAAVRTQPSESERALSPSPAIIVLLALIIGWALIVGIVALAATQL